MLERVSEINDVDPAPWAQRYAGYGWSVIPVHAMRDGVCTCSRRACPSPAKHPRIRWEQAMATAAAPEQIADWWQRWPDANVGVVTGVVSGVAVLDVDPRSGGDATLRRLEDRFGVLPVTPEVRTGGGGRHLWFRVEVEVASVELGAGLDFKAEGGMVVAPPSVHASGKRYVWRPGGGPEDLEVLDVPPWLTGLPAGGAERRVRGDHDTAPARTTAEQEEFAAAWVRAGIELLPGDRYYLCPFHDDHRPSLHIDAEGCRWYCFGCSVGGGIGRLLQALGEHHDALPRARLRQLEGRGLPVTLHGAREVEVVGESHHQDELLELTGGKRRYGGVDVEAVAQLVPDPDNPFDAEAVEVRIQDRTVGHVRRDDHDWLQPLIDDSLDLHGLVTCRALIRGGWDRGRDDVGWFGVVLLLPDPRRG